MDGTLVRHGLQLFLWRGGGFRLRVGFVFIRHFWATPGLVWLLELKYSIKGRSTTLDLFVKVVIIEYLNPLVKISSYNPPAPPLALFVYLLGFDDCLL